MATGAAPTVLSKPPSGRRNEKLPCNMSLRHEKERLNHIIVCQLLPLQITIPCRNLTRLTLRGTGCNALMAIKDRLHFLSIYYMHGVRLCHVIQFNSRSRLSRVPSIAASVLAHKYQSGVHLFLKFWSGHKRFKV